MSSLTLRLCLQFTVKLPSHLRRMQHCCQLDITCPSPLVLAVPNEDQAVTAVYKLPEQSSTLLLRQLPQVYEYTHFSRLLYAYCTPVTATVNCSPIFTLGRLGELWKACNPLGSVPWTGLIQMPCRSLEQGMARRGRYSDLQTHTIAISSPRLAMDPATFQGI